MAPDSVRSLAPWMPRPLTPSAIALLSDRACVLAMAPPLAVSVPLPKAPALSKLTRPPFSVACAVTSGPLTFQVPPLTIRLLKLM
ncbi:Uncharacterised protein [Achromobacter sp. 2789STDY5608621]|nr:Uncharacterised protein [Achromobacter sp. 2789STDY5608621]